MLPSLTISIITSNKVSISIMPIVTHLQYWRKN
nr:MAG TPA: hypothetical protein [Caudoviricetes sp.]DAN29907.1 MAG TPA: hypothetical protein [Caudoviricetes sp.]